MKTQDRSMIQAVRCNLIGEMIASNMPSLVILSTWSYCISEGRPAKHHQPLHCHCYKTAACTNCSNGGKRGWDKEQGKGSFFLKQLNGLGILSLGVSMGSLQCMLIHPSWKSLEARLSQTSKQITSPAHLVFCDRFCAVFVLWNEQRGITNTFKL